MPLHLKEEPLSSLSEIAAQVEQQASMTELMATIQQAEQLVKAKYEVLGQLLQDTAHIDAVARASDEVSEMLNTTLGMIEAFGHACSAAAAAIRGGS